MRRFGICAMVLLLAACGGAAAPSAQGPASTSATTAAVATQAAATTPAGPQISDILKAGKLSTYKVTYKWTITGGGQTQTSEQTWYYKAPKARFDFSAGPAGAGGTFSVYTLEDGTYICTGAGGQTFCQKSPGGSGLDANPAASFGLQLQDHPDQFNASFQGTRSLAGQTAQCYGVKALTGSAFGDVTSCYSSTGVPLLTQIKSQGQEFTMEATNFSTSVSDADFKLPAAAN
jgi:outer membrane lipoprotein-sorting protein